MVLVLLRCENCNKIYARQEGLTNHVAKFLNDFGILTCKIFRRESGRAELPCSGNSTSESFEKLKFLASQQVMINYDSYMFYCTVFIYL